MSQWSAWGVSHGMFVLRYTKDDYNCLHQDISGESYFPYQVIFVLSQQGKDFEGGEIYPDPATPAYADDTPCHQGE